MVEDLYWGSLKVGDWATCFAGTATFLAVCAAIGVPWLQACAARKEAKDRANRAAQVFAIEQAELFIRLRRDLIERRAILASALKGEFDSNPTGLSMQVLVYGADELPSGADLQSLPYPVAPSIAALRSMLAMYNGSVYKAVSLAPTTRMREAVVEAKLANMLDAVQASLARAAKYLGSYEPSYGLLDYLARGDGTGVAPAPEYAVN